MEFGNIVLRINLGMERQMLHVLFQMQIPAFNFYVYVGVSVCVDHKTKRGPQEGKRGFKEGVEEISEHM